MKKEAFLASYLAAYYILLIFVVGISTFLNLPKERRLKQTKIAKLYILYVILSTMVLYINYAYANVPQGSLGNSGFAALLMLFAGWFSLNYAKFSFPSSLNRVSDRVQQKTLSDKHTLFDIIMFIINYDNNFYSYINNITIIIIIII